MKKIYISLFFVISALLLLISVSVNAEELTEEKVDLSNAEIYQFSTSGYVGNVTNDSDYSGFIDGSYSNDMSVKTQNYIVIDMGKEYPISTIKAYQNTDENANIVAFYNSDIMFQEGTKIDSSKLLQVLRTNVTANTDLNGKYYEVSALSSITHNMGSYRYIVLYNWSRSLTLSEIEIYYNTTQRYDLLKIPNFYQDNMVLQRDKNHVIKGYSGTGTSVSVTMTEDADNNNTQTVNAIPDNDGYWTASLLPMKAGKSTYTINISDTSAAPNLVLSNVVVGDVFLAAGQSNMNYDAPKSATAKENLGDISSGYYKKGMYEKQLSCSSDQIRMFKMYNESSGTVTFDVPVDTNWCVSNELNNGVPNILSLSSIAAFFAKNIQEDEIPVGIIQSTWGGTEIGRWVKDGSIYNNHIAPLESLNIAGILWYQGCNDAQEGRFQVYYSKFKSVIQDYRKVLGNQSDLPFIYAQLAPYKNSRPEYEYGGYQRFQIIREEQRKILDDSDINKNLDMIVTLDTIQDTPIDMIHPLGKDILGKRYADVYKSFRDKTDDVVSGPLYNTSTVDGNKVIIKFKENTAVGLKIFNPDYSYEQDGSGKSNSSVLNEFKIAGENGVYYDATATINGESVEVFSGEVDTPKYVRYAYSERPTNANLANGNNLPASPFNISVDGTVAPTAQPEATPTPTPISTPKTSMEPIATPSANDVARVDFDESSTYYTSLNDAISSCPDGGTVNVLKDCVLSQRANISSKSITILSDVDVTVTRVTSGTHGMITFGVSGDSTSRTLTLGGGLGTLTLDGELKTWSVSAITVVNSNYNLITNKGFAIKNYVTTDRGAISIKTGSPTLTLNDIVIDNCTSTRTSADKAGAVHGGSSNSKSVVINGGSFTNCGEDAIIIMTGGFSVTNQMQIDGNVYLYSGIKINADGYTGSKLSIKLNYTPTVGTVIVNNNTDLNKFALTNSGYYLTVTGQNLIVTDVVPPTAEPSATPTIEPSATPTAEPSATPTIEPSATPTVEPSSTPTIEPSATPTIEPSSTPDTTTRTETELNLSGSEYVLTTNAYNIPVGSKIFVAAYGENGALLGINMDSYSGKTIQSQFSKNIGIQSFKIMVWDTTSGIKPLCHAEVVEAIQ